MTTTATAPPAARTCSPAQRVTKSLLGYGVLAAVVFEASVLIQGLTRHGFRIAHDDASLLSNGPLGWIQVTTFLLAGAMTIAAAAGVRRATASRWAPRLIAIYGAGLIGAGILSADPAQGFGPGAPQGRATHVSWHAAGHLIAASVAFIALIAACFVVARYLSRQGRRGMAIYSRVTGVVFGAAFAGVATGSASAAVVVPFYAAVLAAFTWLAIVSIHLYRHVPSAAGARVGLADGKVTVTDGPFTESKELISYALYDVRSREEAIEWASRFVKLHRDLWPGWAGQTDILQVMARAAVDNYEATRSAIEAVWRIESPRLIAGLARITGDVGAAEELAQDALVIALEQWPVQGVPDGPGAWLMATAKHRAIDLVRRRARYDRKLQEVGRDMEAQAQTLGEPDAGKMDDHIGDDLLRLIFIACHPILSRQARAALTLRLIGGLTTSEIARAFLVPEPTIAQRIVRAKRALAEAKIPFEIPARGELPGRLGSVLEVIYLVFNEGYSATSGADWTRPELCAEALRLGRVLAGLMPRQMEVHGLVALMELQASRIGARTGPGGEPVLLADQDRRRWDRLLVRHGLAALDRAEQLGGAPGPYVVQAEIAACHARAASVKDADWERIAALYVVLAHLTPSPVVELNRAVAVGMAYGPGKGLEIADSLTGEPALAGYVQLPAVRGDLLARLGRPSEARAELTRAAELTSNEGERALFRARAAECRPTGSDHTDPQ